MTHQEAQAEAVRRWGKDGQAGFQSLPVNGALAFLGLGEYRQYHCVGTGQIKGRGFSWDEAFADADTRRTNADTRPTNTGGRKE